MDEELRRRLDASRARVDELIRSGRRIRDGGAAASVDAWLRDCAAAVHALSGGSKSHWLSRDFSAALLVRAPGAGVVVEADPMAIVEGILDVLARGASSLASLDGEGPVSAAPPQPRRFDFVQDAALRPVLERSFTDAGEALDRGEFGAALVLTCGILEALLTHALVQAGLPGGAEGLAGWSFEERIAEAERTGIVRGLSRLPASARRYRDLTDPDGGLLPGAAVSAEDARVAGQVLRVVMRDLDPGR